MSGTHRSALGCQGVGPCRMPKMDSQTDKTLKGGDTMTAQETTRGLQFLFIDLVLHM